MNMTEDLSEEKRVWYLKGYEQAERDCEALIKKLVKDISDLSAERLALIDDMDLFGKPQEVERKLNTEIDALKDLLNTAYGVIDSDYDGTEEHQYIRSQMNDMLRRSEINQYAAKRGTDRSDFIRKLRKAINLIKDPEMVDREYQIKDLQDYLNDLKASCTMEVKDVLIGEKK